MFVYKFQATTNSNSKLTERCPKKVTKNLDRFRTFIKELIIKSFRSKKLLFLFWNLKVYYLMFTDNVITSHLLRLYKIISNISLFHHNLSRGSTFTPKKIYFQLTHPIKVNKYFVLCTIQILWTKKSLFRIHYMIWLPFQYSNNFPTSKK